MLDLTVIFLIAGLLFGATQEPAQGKEEKALSPGERERMRLKLALARRSVLDGCGESALERWLAWLTRPLVQWIVGGLFVLIGIIYAVAFVRTHPVYEDFDLTFATSRLLLTKLLPSAALGFLAGISLRMGLRTMNGYLLAFGAVFIVLPFLLVQGSGMLKNFQKIKVGPWFEADIRSTETQKSIEFKVQDALDRSQSGVNLLDEKQYKIVRVNALIDHTIDEQLRRSMAPANNTKRNNQHENVIEYFEQSEFCKVAEYAFVQQYLDILIVAIQNLRENSWGIENTLRDTLGPFVTKAEDFLGEEIRAEDLKDAASSSLVELNRLPQNQNPKPEEPPLNSVNTSAPPCPDVNGSRSPDNDASRIRGNALPHILVSRLYRRIGNDRKALQVLDTAAGIPTVPVKDPTQEVAREPALKNAQQARLLIERGTLRRALGKPGWDTDWKRAAEFWTVSLKKLDGWSESCGENCGDIHKARTHLRFDLAQLRNQYVFSLIQDPDRRRSENFDPHLLDDAVRWAKQNYKDSKELLKLKALTDPDGNTSKPCIEAFYPDTYALALMARNNYVKAGERNNDKDLIYNLLEKALDAADSECSAHPQDIKLIIRQHQKLANNMLDN